MSSSGIRGRIRWDLAKSAVRSGSAAGNRRALEILLEHSRKLVPKDTGKLIHSGRVEMNGEQGRVVYETEYAIIQHERTDFAHPRGGQAKYLEDPANDSMVQREMVNALGEQIRQALGN